MRGLPFQSRSARPFLVAGLLLPAWVAIGTIGYRWIERWSWFDSLYMTVITLTTVGYREVHPLSRAGESFTMVLCVGGIFTLFYATAAILGYIVRGEVFEYFGSRRMERALAELNDHVLVCGLGRMGRFVCHEFSGQKMPFVVIDRDADLLAEFKMPHGIPLHGDAASDEILQRAGIARARCLITVVPSDAANLYITMSARLLNEKLFIVARAEDESSEQKLLRAGASRVVSPYVIGGARVAQAVLRPNVVDFLELATRTEHLELNIEETAVSPESPLVGQSLETSGIRREFGLIIVAIKQAAGQMIFNPPHDTRLAPGDVLIMLGKRGDLDRLSATAGNRRKA
jgi:voltage-gated potassium channel